MASTSILSHCGELVRHYDKERYLCTLFAPEDKRERLFTLFAFNYEVAKIREITHEPMIGMIRLQWWREAIEGIYQGTPRQHEIIMPLARYIQETDIPYHYFDELITARESDLDAVPHGDMESLERYVDHTSSHLVVMALRMLGVKDESAEHAARQVGRAWAFTGMMRAVRHALTQKRIFIPQTMLDTAGITADEVFAGTSLTKLTEVMRYFTEQAMVSVAAARQLSYPKEALPALLPATIAAYHLKHIHQQGYDVFHHEYITPGWLPLVLLWKMICGRF